MNIYLETLKKYWGYPAFRSLQEDIIRSVGDDKKDTLGLLPTGGGKSIIFQVPALAHEGICIVVTPLIALMKDQVENLKKQGIKAVAIYSGMTSNEIDIALNNCVYGAYKFLYLSPERLGTDIFITRVQEMNVNILAIDESHCISQWGYDFRPSYLKITEIRKYLPKVPVLALTATATPEVVDDIQDKLGFKEKNVFRKSFERKNLTYIVRNVEDKLKYLLKIVKKEKGSGVIYVRNRRRTKEIAEFLQENKISADYYHAGISNEQKDYKQEMWKKGNCRIIVSTNAFGMGIDKSDVRFVAHIDLPDSLEAYFQEAGRGGRDEERAYAVLLYHKSDKLKLEKNLTTSFPERKKIRQIYKALGNYYQLSIGSGKGRVFTFDIGDFARQYSLDILSIYNSLKILQMQDYLEFNETPEAFSKILFIIKRDDLYRFQVHNQKFDYFIKLLLRSYSGLFTDYMKINEKQLAQRANSDIKTIKEYLSKLSNLKIINYLPSRRKPTITYIEERLEEKSIFISREIYEDRKVRYSDKIHAIIDYAESDNRCRSQMLLRYFGEKNPNRCGECDICRQKTESGLSEFEYENIKNEIENKLSEKDYLFDNLVDEMKFQSNKSIRVINYLIVNELISCSKDKWLSKK